MSNKALLNAFWMCGDGSIIEFAKLRAHLNRNEERVIELMLDGCYTQEEIAEMLNYSPRRIQDFWYSGAQKLLNIPWVKAYSLYLKEHN